MEIMLTFSMVQRSCREESPTGYISINCSVAELRNVHRPDDLISEIYKPENTWRDLDACFLDGRYGKGRPEFTRSVTYMTIYERSSMVQRFIRQILKLAWVQISEDISPARLASPRSRWSPGGP